MWPRRKAGANLLKAQQRAGVAGGSGRWQGGQWLGEELALDSGAPGGWGAGSE